MLTPGMTTQYPLRGQVSSFENAPFLYSLNRVIRAGRLVTAFVCAQKRGDQELVSPDWENEYLFDNGGKHGVKVRGISYFRGIVH